MTGRYLRKKQDGPRDPTMTHVEDPWAFQPGDWIRSYEGWRYIYSIKDIDANTRFAELRQGADRSFFDALLPDPGAIDPRLADMRLFDFRPYDVENFYQSAWMSDGRPASEAMTLDEARASYEDALREHMRGFKG